MRILAAIVALSVIFTSCQTENTITLSGKYEDPIEGELVKLEMIKDNSTTLVDSFYLEPSGFFERKIKVNEQAFYRLNFQNRAIVNLILDSTDVQISKDPNGSSRSYLVSGSRSTDYLKDLAELESRFETEAEVLTQRFMELNRSGDAQGIQQIRNEFQELKEGYTIDLKNEIWKMDSSIAGAMAISYFEERENEADFIEDLTIKYEKQIPDSYYTHYLRGLVDSWKLLAIGSPAPEINLPSPDGDNVSLSSLKGNYVLIDFWAAWCKPCRQENPNVVRLYNEYHHLGFEILGVSLDKNRDAWLKAINQDNLTWPQVSDLQYFDSEAATAYQIQAIPWTYLIDPDGIIIEKNLRGSALEAKLKEIFG